MHPLLWNEVRISSHKELTWKCYSSILPLVESQLMAKFSLFILLKTFLFPELLTFSQHHGSRALLASAKQ